MARLTMLTEVERPDRDTILLHVHHDPRASYSRAVQPRAMRDVRSHLGGGSVWGFTDVDYDRPDRTDGRCTSTYIFKRQGN